MQTVSFADLMTADGMNDYTGNVAESVRRAFLTPDAPGLLLVDTRAAHGPSCDTAPPRFCVECLRERLCAALLVLSRAPERCAVLARAGLGSDTPRDAAAIGAPFTAVQQLRWSAGREAGAASLDGTGPQERPMLPSANETALELSQLVNAMGELFVDICAATAAACDALLFHRDGKEPHYVLRDALLSAGTAKARAVLYTVASSRNPDAEGAGDGSVGPLQAAHCDFGLFTAISSPLYTLSTSRDTLTSKVCEGGSSSDVSDAFHRSFPHAGLTLLREGGVPLAVHVPRGFVAIQSGEAAQILSRGRIAAAAHSVVRPQEGQLLMLEALGGAAVEKSHCLLTRCVFVLFAQPPWSMALAPTHATNGDGGQEGVEGDVLRASVRGGCEPLEALIPPLRTRWDAAAPPTFATFAKCTAEAYYGRGGRQRRTT